MAQVRLDAATKVYPGGVVAVRELTLAADDGKWLALLGPSGSGKSTVLRLVAGLEEVTSGTIHIGGRDMSRVPPRERGVAMVFQTCALFPHLTAGENLSFGLSRRAGSREEARRRVREAALLLGIQDLLERRPAALSGGERQRVALGRALVQRPRVLLLDEPLSGLDAQLRVQMRSELRELRRPLQTTTIHVTHDQEEALALGDSVAVLRDGALQQVGEPLQVHDRPRNRFVAGFVGLPAMNLLPGRLVAEGGSAWFEGAGLELRLDDAAARRLDGGAHADLVLGVRPKDVAIEAASSGVASGDGRRPAAFSTARVSGIEALGARTDVRLATREGQELVAVAPAGAALRPGEEVRVRIDPARIHLFDSGPEGRNLLA